MSRNYLRYPFFLLVIICDLSYGQEKADKEQLINTGLFSVRSETVLSTQFDFVNTTNGDFVNDGNVIFYQDFTNDGHYGLTPMKKTSTAYFVLNQEAQPKQIKGAGLTSLYNVEFDSERNGVAFDLKNNIDIHGLAHFKNGIVKVDHSKREGSALSLGMISF